MEEKSPQKIEMSPIGYVSRASAQENDRDRNLVAQIVLDESLIPALEGIDEWSHIYVIFWLDQAGGHEDTFLQHANLGTGVFAARSPRHPNRIGLTLVELVKRDANILWIRGLDAFDGTPVLDLKPYPDWDRELIVVTDFKIPGWLDQIITRNQNTEHGRLA